MLYAIEVRSIAKLIFKLYVPLVQLFSKGGISSLSLNTIENFGSVKWYKFRITNTKCFKGL